MTKIGSKHGGVWHSRTSNPNAGIERYECRVPLEESASVSDSRIDFRSSLSQQGVSKRLERTLKGKSAAAQPPAVGRTVWTIENSL
jgi:hypothetical protein